MPKKVYVVTLSPEERKHLDTLIRSGKRSARTITRARILLMSDQSEQGPGWEDRRVVEALGCGQRTVERIRERFVQQGLDAALYHKRQSKRREPVLDEDGQAQLVALVRQPTPDGRKRWTLQMLADKLVEKEVVTSISKETVRRMLRKCGLTSLLAPPSAPQAQVPQAQVPQAQVTSTNNPAVQAHQRLPATAAGAEY